MPDLSSTDNDATLVSSVMMTVDGAEYICETYEIDGETVKYYYLNNGDLARIETYDPETDTSTIMIIKSISGTVDESLFELPLGYISLSGLGDSYDFDNSFGEIEDEPAGFFERVIQAVLGFFSFC